jgi:FAD/FMN-containing dehydrogenase
MTDVGIRCVNAAKYALGRHAHGRRYTQSHAAFAFLFDYIPDWKRAYGPGGLIEYQSLVPEASAERVFSAQIALARARGIVPYIAVFKRHRRDAFLLTHAVDGYSLALHFKVTPRTRERLWGLAHEFDRLVLEAGGRFHLAKDATLDADTFQRGLGSERLARLRALKRACDPEGLLETDQYRRLLKPSVWR